MPLPDLAQLQANALRQKQAGQELAGVEEKYKRAQGLSQMTAPTQYGASSPVALISDLIRGSIGRRQQGRLAPQREALQAEQATLAGQREGSNLQLALAKEQREIESHEREMGQFGGDLITLEKKGSPDLAAVMAPDGTPRVQDAEGNWTKPSPEGYTEKGRGYFGRGGSRKTMGVNRLSEFTDMGNQVRKVGEVVGNFDPKFSQIKGIPMESLNNMLASASRADILKFASETADNDAREAAQWWADWKMTYELLQRHALFGATLTNNEMKSWKDAVHTLRGMKGEDVQRRIDKLFKDLRDDMANDVTAQRIRSKDDSSILEALDYTMGNAGFDLTGEGRYSYRTSAPEGGGPNVPPEFKVEYDAADAAGKARIEQLLQTLQEAGQAPEPEPAPRVLSSAARRRSARGQQ